MLMTTARTVFRDGHVTTDYTSRTSREPGCLLATTRTHHVLLTIGISIGLLLRIGFNDLYLLRRKWEGQVRITFKVESASLEYFRSGKVKFGILFKVERSSFSLLSKWKAQVWSTIKVKWSSLEYFLTIKRSKFGILSDSKKDQRFLEYFFDLKRSNLAYFLTVNKMETVFCIV